MKTQLLQGKKKKKKKSVLNSQKLLTNIPNFYSLQHELRLHNEENNINNCDWLQREQQQAELHPLPLRAGWESTVGLSNYYNVVEKGVDFKLTQHSTHYFHYNEEWRRTPNPEQIFIPRSSFCLPLGLRLLTHQHNTTDSTHTSMPQGVSPPLLVSTLRRNIS